VAIRLRREYHIYCPSCGACISSSNTTCYSCEFPVEKKLEEGSATILRIDTGFAERRRLAADPNTKPALLGVLSSDPLPLVRRAAAANPHLPSNLIPQFATDSDDSIRAALASNSSLSSSDLDQFASDDSNMVKRQVLLNPNATDNAINAALHSMGEKARRAMAQDPKLPERVMLYLAKDNNDYVRKGLATNISCPRDILFALARSGIVSSSTASNATTRTDIDPATVHELKQYEKIRIAENPNCPSDVLQELTSYALQAPRRRESRLLRALFCNPSIPHESLHAMTSLLEKDYFAFRFSSNPRLPFLFVDTGRFGIDMLLFFAKSKHRELRMAAADDPRLGVDVLESLTIDKEPKVRSRVALNRNLTPSMFERLALDEDRDVRRSVLCNPWIPKDLISSVGHGTFGTLEKVLIARNPDVDPGLLSDISLCTVGWNSHDSTTPVRAEAAQNPAAAIWLLDALAHDTYREVRQLVACNINAPDRVTKIAMANEVPTPVRGKINIPDVDCSYLGFEDIRDCWSAESHSAYSDAECDFLIPRLISLWNERKGRPQNDTSYSMSEIASNDSVTIRTMEVLSRNKSDDVRRSLAINRCLPSYLQRYLAFDKDESVRLRLARNDFSCLDVLDILSYDLDRETRENAARRIRKFGL
jgi:hypothetical protein